jgi:signal transduction histidine kinase
MTSRVERDTAHPQARPSTGGEIATFALAVVLGALGLAVSPPAGGVPAWAAAVSAGIGSVALLGLRRSRPALVAVLVVLASTFWSAAFGAALVAIVSLATWRRWWSVLGVGALFVATTTVDALTGDSTGPWWRQDVAALVLYGALVGLGAYQGSRRELVEALGERARAAEREQAARVEQAKVAERARIAREMHDVLAHRISLVAMNAGVLAFRTDLPADQAAATAGVVRDNANLALVELKQVLGVLRSSDGSSDGSLDRAPGVGAPVDVPERPQPTLADLDDLVREAVEGGGAVRVDIDVETSGRLAELPSQLSRDAYRIVQEALTNARKHAPGSPVVVQVDGAPGGLLNVEVRNAPSASASSRPVEGARMGLVGVAERARLAGGRLEHGPDRHGGYVLLTVLPWPEEGP